MRIIYIGKHRSGGNDDEGAIAHVLLSLGHEVVQVIESRGYRAIKYRGDLALFHHWSDSTHLEQLSMPRAFWYFDLVTYPDRTLQARNDHRETWMSKMTPLVDVGFCTDGDWVARDKSNTLVRLLQGCDERYAGRDRAEQDIDILFTGSFRGGGVGRESFVRGMSERYGSGFYQATGHHRENLRALIARSKIVVAPDHPITDNYWSNRVYLTLGFGGFLLHPYAETLTQHYAHGREIVYYRSREELHEQIAYYLSHPEEREAIQEAALQRSLAEHTYRHRVEQMLSILESRLI